MDGQILERASGEAELLRENRSLKRQLRNLESLFQRNKAMLAARTNVNTLLATQQEKMEKNLRLLLENSPDIILLFDQSGRFTYCTKSFLTAVDIANFGLIGGRHFSEVFRSFAATAWLTALEQKFTRAMEQHEVIVSDDALDFSNRGDVHNYSINITPMLSEDGKAEGAMMLFHDLTDIIKAKEAAEKANNAKSEFLATMSHEMRTPMNAIIGMTHIAIGAEDPHKKAEALEKIETASSHLLSVINDILDMSKIESGKLELLEGEFELPALLSGVTAVIQHVIDQKKQVLIQKIDPAAPRRLIGDEHRLWQIITNLISNAVKFTPEGGTITLEVSLLERTPDACRLCVEVTDTGIGISKEQQEKLFRSFVQADSSVSRRFGGTGLGLVISKSLVEMMRGEIGIDSDEGHGSRFYFSVWLRLAGGADGRSEDSCAETPGEAPDYTGLFAGRKLLLADDIDINREIVAAMLEPTGARIDMARDGAEACRLFAESGGAYDLILMDLHMPEVDGYEAARFIRASSLAQAASIPIIAMTADVFMEDICRCLAEGMNGHIGKPIMIHEMISTIRQHLQPQE